MGLFFQKNQQVEYHSPHPHQRSQTSHQRLCVYPAPYMPWPYASDYGAPDSSAAPVSVPPAQTSDRRRCTALARPERGRNRHCVSGSTGDRRRPMVPRACAFSDRPRRFLAGLPRFSWTASDSERYCKQSLWGTVILYPRSHAGARGRSRDSSLLRHLMMIRIVS